MTKHIKFKSKLAFLVLARVKGTTSQLSLKTWLGFCNVGGDICCFPCSKFAENNPLAYAEFSISSKSKGSFCFQYH